MGAREAGLNKCAWKYKFASQHLSSFTHPPTVCFIFLSVSAHVHTPEARMLLQRVQGKLSADFGAFSMETFVQLACLPHCQPGQCLGYEMRGKTFIYNLTGVNQSLNWFCCGHIPPTPVSLFSCSCGVGRWHSVFEPKRSMKNSGFIFLPQRKESHETAEKEIPAES